MPNFWMSFSNTSLLKPQIRNASRVCAVGVSVEEPMVGWWRLVDQSVDRLVELAVAFHFLPVLWSSDQSFDQSQKIVSNSLRTHNSDEVGSNVGGPFDQEPGRKLDMLVSFSLVRRLFLVATVFSHFDNLEAGLNRREQIRISWLHAVCRIDVTFCSHIPSSSV